ncbi:hypothetical protein [Flavobacterium sp.]|uniref:hypothetical protein n=1 Tax=Flavobacterium sp. TaxID=239 RepID=UPI0037527797
MKKLIITACFLAAFTNLNAQSFTEGTKVAQVGIGLGSDFGTPIGASFEYGISETFGVGAYIGYASKTYPVFTDSYKVTSTLFGARGNYHFYTEDKIDVYGGAILGYNSASAKWEGNNNSPILATYGGVVYGGVVGGRYYFTESIGAFAEAGYGIGYLTVGIVAKF